jgi:hypothetical protein
MRLVHTTCQRLCSLGMVLAVLATLGARPVSAGGIAAPIALNGWNANVITDKNQSAPVTSFDYGNDPGLGSWFESGAKGHNDGLPAGMDFTSQRVNSVTGTNTVFHLQPAGGANALKMGAINDLTHFPATGTLTLATPGSYSSLAILASSGAAFGGGSGTLTLHFADGKSSGPLSYDASDWNKSFAADPTHIALGPVSRNGDIGPDGKGFTYNTGDVNFVMYETDIDLAALGLDTEILDSITFTSASNAPDQFAITGVFAVSGVAAPEPASITLLGLGTLGLLGYGWRQRRVGRI